MSTKDAADALTGATLNAAEQAAYAVWAELIEQDDYEPNPAAEGVAFEGEEAAAYSSALLDELIGAEELEAAIRRGRPGLSGETGHGPSPKRQVRLPHDLDERLQERALADHADLSAVIRDAIDFYLRAPDGAIAFVQAKIDPAPIARRAHQAQRYAARLAAGAAAAELNSDDQRELIDLLRSLGQLAELEARTLEKLQRAG
jgi:hypothetical protein